MYSPGFPGFSVLVSLPAFNSFPVFISFVTTSLLLNHPPFFPPASSCVLVSTVSFLFVLLVVEGLLAVEDDKEKGTGIYVLLVVDCEVEVGVVFEVELLVVLLLVTLLVLLLLFDLLVSLLAVLLVDLSVVLSVVAIGGLGVGLVVELVVVLLLLILRGRAGGGLRDDEFCVLLRS